MHKKKKKKKRRHDGYAAHNEDIALRVRTETADMSFWILGWS
jgi:hypothetical protein